MSALRRSAPPATTTRRTSPEPSWAGATWYGDSSGTYWTVNPKEYADPRKHGPEYLARARRAAGAADPDPGGWPGTGDAGPTATPDPTAPGPTSAGDPATSERARPPTGSGARTSPGGGSTTGRRTADPGGRTRAIDRDRGVGPARVDEGFERRRSDGRWDIDVPGRAGWAHLHLDVDRVRFHVGRAGVRRRSCVGRPAAPGCVAWSRVRIFRGVGRARLLGRIRDVGRTG